MTLIVHDGEIGHSYGAIIDADATRARPHHHRFLASPALLPQNLSISLRGRTRLAGRVQMSNHGSFSGNPKTEWLVDASGEDRKMRLLEDFSFTDPDEKVWFAAKESVVDGASIPRALWALVGSPYTDDYRRASVVHDVACGTIGVDRKKADVMFFHACRAGGCSHSQARVLYAGVRIGAWSSSSLPPQSLDRDRVLFRRRLDVPVLEEEFLKGKLADIARDMEVLGPEPTIEEMDNIIERHIRIQP